MSKNNIDRKEDPEKELLASQYKTAMNLLDIQEQRASKVIGSIQDLSERPGGKEATAEWLEETNNYSRDIKSAKGDLEKCNTQITEARSEFTWEANNILDDEIKNTAKVRDGYLKLLEDVQEAIGELPRLQTAEGVVDAQYEQKIGEIKKSFNEKNTNDINFDTFFKKQPSSGQYQVNNEALGIVIAASKEQDDKIEALQEYKEKKGKNIDAQDFEQFVEKVGISEEMHEGRFDVLERLKGEQDLGKQALIRQIEAANELADKATEFLNREEQALKQIEQEIGRIENIKQREQESKRFHEDMERLHEIHKQANEATNKVVANQEEMQKQIVKRDAKIKELEEKNADLEIINSNVVAKNLQYQEQSAQQIRKAAREKPNKLSEEQQQLIAQAQKAVSEFAQLQAQNVELQQKLEETNKELVVTKAALDQAQNVSGKSAEAQQEQRQSQYETLQPIGDESPRTSRSNSVNDLGLRQRSDSSNSNFGKNFGDTLGGNEQGLDSRRGSFDVGNGSPWYQDPRVSDLERQVAELTQKLAAAEEKDKARTQELTEANKARDDQAQRADTAEARNATLGEENQRLKSENSGLTQDNKRLAEDLGERDQVIAAQAEMIEAVEGKMREFSEAFEIENADLQSQLEEQGKAHAKSLEDQKRSFEEKYAESQQTIEQQAADIIKLKDQVREESEKTRAALEAAQKLTDQQKQKQSQGKSVAVGTEDLENPEVKKLQDRLATLEKEKAKDQRSIEDLKKEAQQQRKKHQEDLRKKDEEHKKETDKLKQEIERRKADLQKQADQINQQNKKQRIDTKRADNAEVAVSEKDRENQKKIDKLNEKHAEELEGLHTQIFEKDLRLVALSEEIGEMKRALENINQDMAKKDAEIQKLTAQNASITGELEAFKNKKVSDKGVETDARETVEQDMQTSQAPKKVFAEASTSTGMGESAKAEQEAAQLKKSTASVGIDPMKQSQSSESLQQTQAQRQGQSNNIEHDLANYFRTDDESLKASQQVQERASQRQTFPVANAPGSSTVQSAVLDGSVKQQQQDKAQNGMTKSAPPGAGTGGTGQNTSSALMNPKGQKPPNLEELEISMTQSVYITPNGASANNNGVSALGNSSQILQSEVVARDGENTAAQQQPPERQSQSSSVSNINPLNGLNSTVSGAGGGNSARDSSPQEILDAARNFSPAFKKVAAVVEEASEVRRDIESRYGNSNGRANSGQRPLGMSWQDFERLGNPMLDDVPSASQIFKPATAGAANNRYAESASTSQDASGQTSVANNGVSTASTQSQETQMNGTPQVQGQQDAPRNVGGAASQTQELNVTEEDIKRRAQEYAELEDTRMLDYETRIRLAENDYKQKGWKGFANSNNQQQPKGQNSNDKSTQLNFAHPLFNTQTGGSAITSQNAAQQQQSSQVAAIPPEKPEVQKLDQSVQVGGVDASTQDNLSTDGLQQQSDKKDAITVSEEDIKKRVADLTSLEDYRNLDTEVLTGIAKDQLIDEMKRKLQEAQERGVQAGGVEASTQTDFDQKGESSASLSQSSTQPQERELTGQVTGAVQEAGQQLGETQVGAGAPKIKGPTDAQTAEEIRRQFETPEGQRERKKLEEQAKANTAAQDQAQNQEQGQGEGKKPELQKGGEPSQKDEDRVIVADAEIDFKLLTDRAAKAAFKPIVKATRDFGEGFKNTFGTKKCKIVREEKIKAFMVGNQASDSEEVAKLNAEGKHDGLFEAQKKGVEVYRERIKDFDKEKYDKTYAKQFSKFHEKVGSKLPGVKWPSDGKTVGVASRDAPDKPALELKRNTQQGIKLGDVQVPDEYKNLKYDLIDVKINPEALEGKGFAVNLKMRDANGRVSNKPGYEMLVTKDESGKYNIAMPDDVRVATCPGIEELNKKFGEETKQLSKEKEAFEKRATKLEKEYNEAIVKATKEGKPISVKLGGEKRDNMDKAQLEAELIKLKEELQKEREQLNQKTDNLAKNHEQSKKDILAKVPVIVEMKGPKGKNEVYTLPITYDQYYNYDKLKYAQDPQTIVEQEIKLFGAASKENEDRVQRYEAARETAARETDFVGVGDKKTQVEQTRQRSGTEVSETPPPSKDVSRRESVADLNSVSGDSNSARSSGTWTDATDSLVASQRSSVSKPPEQAQQQQEVEVRGRSDAQANLADQKQAQPSKPESDPQHQTSVQNVAPPESAQNIVPPEQAQQQQQQAQSGDAPQPGGTNANASQGAEVPKVKGVEPKKPERRNTMPVGGKHDENKVSGKISQDIISALQNQKSSQQQAQSAADSNVQNQGQQQSSVRRSTIKKGFVIE